MAQYLVDDQLGEVEPVSDTEEFVTHGEAWVFTDRRKLARTAVNEFVDRIEFLANGEFHVGRIIRKPQTNAWVVDFGDGVEARIQHVGGCGCGGAPAVTWENDRR